MQGVTHPSRQASGHAGNGALESAPKRATARPALLQASSCSETQLVQGEVTGCTGRVTGRDRPRDSVPVDQ